MLDLDDFRLGLTKGGRSWENGIGQKGVWTLCGELGETARPVHSNSSQHLGDEDASFLWGWGGHPSHKGFMTCLRGRSESPSYLCCFWNSRCLGFLFWDRVSWTLSIFKTNNLQFRRPQLVSQSNGKKKSGGGQVPDKDSSNIIVEIHLGMRGGSLLDYTNQSL